MSSAPYTAALAALAERARQVRVARGFTQAELASRAGVGVATVQRFERDGRSTLENVLRLAFALGVDAPFERLFEPPPFRTLDEALTRPTAPPPRRRVRGRGRG